MQEGPAVLAKLLRTCALRVPFHRRRLLHKLKAAGVITGAFVLLAVAGCDKKDAAPPPMPPEVEVTSVTFRSTRSGSRS